MENSHILVSGDSSEVLPTQQRKAIVEKLLSIICKYEDVIISGSFSLQIANLIDNNKLNLNNLDLDILGDIDIGSFKAISREDIDSLVTETAQGVFKIHNNIFLHASPHDSMMENLAIAKIDIVCGEHTFLVRYTTPAFLLLTTVSQDDKTSNEKRKEKIRVIQKSPLFSSRDFISLANYEVKSAKRMNEQTFETWKRVIQENYKHIDMGTIKNESKDISSIVNLERLEQRFLEKGSLKDVNFTDIIQSSTLELFLNDYTKSDS